MDPEVRAILNYFRAQQGGAFLPVYSGNYQTGTGAFGDFFKNVLKTIIPIVLQGVSTFTSSAIDSNNRGMSFRDSAKSAIMPTIKSVLTSASDQISRQSGSGKISGPYIKMTSKRRKRSKRSKKPKSVTRRKKYIKRGKARKSAIKLNF